MLCTDRGKGKIASACDLFVVSGLAIPGILMTPVHPLVIGMTFMVALAFMLLLDQARQWITRRPSSQAQGQ